jgi:hypothetical protein
LCSVVREVHGISMCSSSFFMLVLPCRTSLFQKEKKKEKKKRLHSNDTINIYLDQGLIVATAHESERNPRKSLDQLRICRDCNRIENLPIYETVLLII